jgi:hypothetical protein
MFFVRGAGLQLGLDLNTRELKEPAFWRAVVVRGCLLPCKSHVAPSRGDAHH